MEGAGNKRVVRREKKEKRSEVVDDSVSTNIFTTAMVNALDSEFPSIAFYPKYSPKGN